MGIVDRLRALVGGDAAAGGTGAGGDVDAEAIAEEQAIEAVEAAREAAKFDAAFAITDTPGSVDGPD